MLFRNSDIVWVEKPFSSIAVVRGVTFIDNNFAYDLNINGMYYPAINEDYIIKLVSRNLTSSEIDFYLEMLHTHLKNNKTQYVEHIKDILNLHKNRKITY